MSKHHTEAPKTLYTPADVKVVRNLLLQKQNGLDALTGLPIPEGQAVLDHDHTTQYVRAVLHRQSNAAAGKIENIYVRFLSWWYPGTLPDFLRDVAKYLETDHPKSFVHPAWLKKAQVKFNKLKSSEQDTLLILLGSTKGKNTAERKELFKKVLLTKKHDFVTIESYVNNIKEYNN